MVKAHQLAEETDRQFLKGINSSSQNQSSLVNQVKEIYDNLNILQLTQIEIEKHIATVNEQLRTFNHDRSEILKSYLNSLAERNY